MKTSVALADALEDRSPAGTMSSPLVRPLVVLGNPSPALVEGLRAVAADALPGVPKPLVFGAGARACIESGMPCVAIVDGDDDTSEEEALRLRRNPAHATTPLIGLASSADEIAFSTNYGCGGDDVVPKGELHRLLPRVRSLQSASTSSTASRERDAPPATPTTRPRAVPQAALPPRAW